MSKNNKLVRITTVPQSLKTLLKGQHQFMANHFEVIGISSDGQDLKEVHEEEGIRVIPITMTRIISPIKDLKALYQLYSLLKKEKPLIIHSHTPKAGIVGMLAAKFARVPHRLHTVAGLPLMEAVGNKRKLLNFVERLTYSCATKVYPNSQGLYDFILDNKFTKRDKLKVIANGSSNGINTAFFDPNLFSDANLQTLENSLKISSDDFVFVFVGRLVADKGINELVSSFDRLCKVNKNVKLLLVGGLENDLDPLQIVTLETMKTNKQILSVGFQKDVRPYLALSDCLVFPSYREGFPNVVMQAGAMSLPSIVTNINGCNEIIIDGENGVIIPVKDADALFDAMQHMMLNHEFRNQLKENARNMIISRYEQKVVWEALLKEYQLLLQNV